MKRIYLLSLSLLFTQLLNAQCPAGEAEVTIVVGTDAYGYEGYWQIVPSGNACGVGTIAEGGNLAVGCNGAGLQNQTPGGYGNNGTFNEGPWCLPLGNSYDLIFVDDWGDGGFTFDVYVNGFQIATFEGMALGGTFPFVVAEPPAYDLSLFGSNLYSYMSTGMYDLSVHVFNGGTTTINSYDLNYQINGGPIYTHNVVGTLLANYASEQVTHSLPVNVTTNGVYQIDIWADNLNGGNLDENTWNDTLSEPFEAGPGIPNYIDGYINASVTIDQIAGSADQVNAPTDLDFHPVLSNNELWVINKGTEGSGGSTVTIFDAGEVGQTSLWKQDGNAWHFMSLPTAMSFSKNGNWATAPGVFDANHDGGAAFTGPSLWSGNLGIYAEPSGGNGSHLDMLHLSPYSQGITTEKDNIFWVFDGYTDDIVRYDFVEDHGPGNDFHGDATVLRYSDDIVVKDPANQIVSHLVLDDNLQWLYVVDHGNQRVIRIDINTGSDMGGAPNYPMNEPIAVYDEITGYTQELVVSGLSKPAGIDVIDDRMIVSEYETGEIIIYDISVMPAIELERISTGLTSVQGIKIGPDGRIWFVDYNSDGVYKIETAGLSVEEITSEFNVYPNPSTGNVSIFVENETNGTIEVRDLNGRLVSTKSISGHAASIEMNVEAGMYFVSLVINGKRTNSKQLVIQ